MNIFPHKDSTDAEIARQAMEACEHIISEIGAELHDDLIQRLSIFRLSLEKLEMSMSDRPQADLLLANLKAEFQQVIESVRKITRGLTPERSNDNSFEQNLAMICHAMERSATSHIRFETHGTAHDISELAEIHLSRIIQELIHNAYIHSSAWHIWVRLTWLSETLEIEVEDDGTAFSKITEFLTRLKKKHNTLRLRCNAIGANIDYIRGRNGLLVKVRFNT